MWAPSSHDINVPNRFKYRQNPRITVVLVSIFVCRSKSFQIPSQLKHTLVTLLSSISLQFQNACYRDIVSQKKSAFPNLFKYRQNACLRDNIFKKLSAVPNRFKYRHNACVRDIVFILFSAVPNRFKYRHSACFKDIVFKIILHFQIVSNPVAMQCFSYIAFIYFSAVPNRFKSRHNAMF